MLLGLHIWRRELEEEEEENEASEKKKKNKEKDIPLQPKNPNSNQPRKRRRQNIPRIQNTNPRRQLFSRIKNPQNIQRPGIIRCFHDSQKKSREKQPDKITRKGCETGDDGPEEHAGGHVVGRAQARDEHVGGDLAENVADEEDGDAGLVLGAGEVGVGFEGAEAGEGDGVAVEVVEPVH